jgi:hypothetical protein
VGFIRGSTHKFEASRLLSNTLHRRCIALIARLQRQARKSASLLLERHAQGRAGARCQGAVAARLA